MAPRIPTEADFAPLHSSLPHRIHFPSPPESTTAILILLHGLGDTHLPFHSFAQGMNLPGVLCVAIRGTSSLPLAGEGHFHWGDDVVVDERGVDADPGFQCARKKVVEELIEGVLVGKCGWETSDLLIFGYGQGGSLALGIASLNALKGIVTIGGPVPRSMIRSGTKSGTPVLAVQLDEEQVDRANGAFESVQVVRWRRPSVGMPRDREEMFPIMKFLAQRLKGGWS